VFQSTVYCGLPKGTPSEHYVQGVLETTKQLINKLGELQEIRGRNVTFDR
jgi:hypothetical protein